MPPISFGWLGGLTGRLVTLGLMHSLWIGLLASSAAAIALTIIPNRRRGAQYAVLLAALGLVALGPPIATALQRCRAASREPSPTGSFVISQAAPAPEATIVAAPVPLPPPVGIPRHAWYEPIVSRTADAFDFLQPILLAAWLLVAIPMLSLVVMGLLATGIRRHRARPALAEIQERSDEWARRIGLRRPTPVLVHPTISEPCLCGLIRPAVLLPGRWLQKAEAAEIDAVLAHELAHERRLDLPVNLVQRLMEAVFFFHPAILWLSRSLRDRRERCADAMAAALTGDPLALAEALESVARLRPTARRTMPLCTSLGGDDPSLLSRVQELFGMTPTRPSVRLWHFASLPVAALVALLSAHLGLAQDRPTDAPKAEEHPLDVRAVQPNKTAGQISYEVRFIEAEASGWRRSFEDRLRRVEAGGFAWMLDRDIEAELLALFRSDASAELVQAPKVTAYEGSTATIFNKFYQHYVADIKPIVSADSVSFLPEMGKLDLGTSVSLSGAIRNEETDITVDLHDKALIAFYAFYREGKSSLGRMMGYYQVPTTTEDRRRFSCSIPDGDALLVSLGLHDRPARLTGTAEVAASLLGAVAGTDLEPRGQTVERLVLITPCQIMKEDHLPVPALAPLTPQEQP